MGGSFPGLSFIRWLERMVMRWIRVRRKVSNENYWQRIYLPSWDEFRVSSFRAFRVDSSSENSWNKLEGTNAVSPRLLHVSLLFVFVFFFF